MIISVEKAKDFINFPDGWTDEKIKMKLLSVAEACESVFGLPDSPELSAFVE